MEIQPKSNEDIFDKGTDTFEISYKDKTGQLQTQAVKKTNTNRWQETILTTNFYQFNNSLKCKADILLDPAHDGDDIFHLIEVTRNSSASCDNICRVYVPLLTTTKW